MQPEASGEAMRPLQHGRLAVRRGGAHRGTRPWETDSLVSPTFNPDGGWSRGRRIPRRQRRSGRGGVRRDVKLSIIAAVPGAATWLDIAAHGDTVHRWYYV